MTLKSREVHENNAIEGIYVNYFKVGYNAEVFVFDQYQIFSCDQNDTAPEDTMQCPRVRMISSPIDAKLLLSQLKASIAEYEKTYGNIQMLDQNTHS